MAETQDLIAQLRDEDPDARVQACILLRKEGDPAAVPELARLYEQEDDPVVKEAAADTLRFFAKEGGGGGGSPVLRNLSVLLVISLVVLVALNVVTRMGTSDDTPEEAEVTPGPTQAEVPSSRDILLTDYGIRWLNATNDVTALRAEYTAETLACAATLERPEPVFVQEIDRQTYPDIVFVDTLNQAITDLQTTTADYDAACTSGTPVTAEQRTAATSTLDSIEATLNDVGTAINDSMTNPAATVAPPTPVPTATFNVTLTPSPTATFTLVPTLNPEVQPVVSDLTRIINNTETELNSLISNKWNAVQGGGVSPFGCTGATFNDAYGDASEALLADEPDLAAIIVVLNEALVAAQSSADTYATNCNNGTLNATVVDQGLNQALSALSNIELAKGELNRLYPQ